MSSQQIDNSYFFEKVALRIKSLQHISKHKIKVLDCFAGDGLIWSCISKKSDKIIDVTPIDQKSKDRVYLKGDNLKYLSNMELCLYDIIDLDSYGIPFDQMEIINDREYHGLVHFTAIQSIYGRIPSGLLEKIGYPSKMIKKCPTLFYKDFFRKFSKYLLTNGINELYYIYIQQKLYGYFKR